MINRACATRVRAKPCSTYRGCSAHAFLALRDGVVFVRPRFQILGMSALEGCLLEVRICRVKLGEKASTFKGNTFLELWHVHGSVSWSREIERKDLTRNPTFG